MAIRTISDSGGNYNAVGTWVEGIVPTNTDDVIATTTSGQLTVNVASAALTVDFTNYTNTLTINADLTVSGNVTLVATMIILGTAYLTLNATAILTSNTKSIPNLKLAGTSKTYTFADNWTITNELLLNGTTSQTINGNTIDTINLTNSATGSITGTTDIIINNTGTWRNTTNGILKNNLTLNTGSTINGKVYYSTGTLTTPIGASIEVTGSTLNIGTGLAGAILDLNGLTLNNLTLNNVSGSIRLKSGLIISGLFTNVNGATFLTIKVSNSEYPPEQSDTYVKATSTYASNYCPYFATDPIKFVTDSYVNNGWMATTGSITNQRFHIDLGSAKIIEEVYYENNHYFGTVTDRGVKNFTLWGSNSATDFADLTYANDGTWVQLTTDILQFEQHVESNIPNPKYIVITNSTAYRYYAFKFINNWGNSYYMGIRRIELRKANTPRTLELTLLQGATQDLCKVNTISIDSSNGQTIWSHKGTFANTLNWKQLLPPKTISFSN